VPVAATSETAAQLVLIGPGDPSGILVRLGQRTRVVAVAERQGASAARVVALVIADLVAGEMSASPEPLATATAHASLPAQGLPFELPPLRFTAVAGGSKGTGSEEPLCFALDVDVVGLFHGILLGLAFDLVRSPERRRRLPDDFAYTAGIARLLVGWRRGPLELLGGPFASPYDVAGTVEHTGILVGAGAIARVSLRMVDRLHLVIGGRVDGYANRVHVVWPTGAGFATPRFDAALGVGLAWEFKP
jgi:hypothetical protein